MIPGKVYIVGSGPGDPALLTVRARDLLLNADVVAYDALISPSILALINPKAELIPIGYRGYGSSKLSYQLHPKVLEMARKHKIVVRLKSGDPFIFGRGADECEILNKENIQYEIIPGISSAFGAAIYAGFPLTHRKIASDVTLVSGHDLRGGSPSNSKWDALSKAGGTMAIYMAAKKIGENCRRLIDHGRSPDTPAIYVASATNGDQKIIQGVLRNLGELTISVDQKKHALILVGDVISKRIKFNWRENLPLKDKRLLLVRAREGNSIIGDQLTSLGADLIQLPYVKVKSDDAPFFKNLLLDQENFLFSDSTTAKMFPKLLAKNRIDIRDLKGKNFYVLDDQTESELNKIGMVKLTHLKGHCLNALCKLKVEINQNSYLNIFGGNVGRISLMEDLLSLKLKAEYFSIYKKEVIFPDFTPPQFDGIVFPSSSAVKILAAGPWKNTVKNTSIFCIGEKTFKQAKEYLHQKVYMAREDTIDSLINLIRSHYGT